MTGNELKTIRTRLGLSLREFGELIGKSYEIVRLYELGVHIIPKEVEIAIKAVERGAKLVICPTCHGQGTLIVAK